MQLLLEAPESQMYTPAPFKTLLTPLPRRVRTDIVGFGFIVKNDKTEGLLGMKNSWLSHIHQGRKEEYEKHGLWLLLLASYVHKKTLRCWNGQPSLWEQVTMFL